MAIATIEGSEEAAPDRVVVRPAPRQRRRRVTALFASGVVAVVLVGLGGYRTVQAGHGSSTFSGWDASSRRLEAEAEAYFAQQANVARGRAADSARLEAAADAYFAQQTNVARGRAADSARLESAADAYFAQQANVARGR